MASSIIHICVANEINKKLNKSKNALLIGSIAPDLSKQIGENKIKSHFLDNQNSIPNLNNFLKKYQKDLNDDFVLGYYIHLYTDYLWFKYFEPTFLNNDYISYLDGRVVKLPHKTVLEYVYQDYTNLNIRLIDEYNLDLALFYEEIPKLNNIIKEIPMDKISIIVNKAGEIIENSHNEKLYIFDINKIKDFIDSSVKEIYNNLQEV